MLPTEFFWELLSHTGFSGEGDLEVERKMFSFTSKYNKKQLESRIAVVPAWGFEMHCGQGACCIRLKKFTEAIVQYELALTIAKQFGDCASDWPNGGKGITYCSDRIVEGSPYCGLGQCYLELG